MKHTNLTYIFMKMGLISLVQKKKKKKMFLSLWALAYNFDL